MITCVKGSDVTGGGGGGGGLSPPGVPIQKDGSPFEAAGCTMFKY